MSATQPPLLAYHCPVCGGLLPWALADVVCFRCEIEAERAERAEQEGQAA